MQINPKYESVVKITQVIKKLFKFEVILLSLFVLGGAIELSILIVNCYGIEQLTFHGNYRPLMYLRISNFSLSVLVVAFNIYLLQYFTRMFQFLLTIITHKRRRYMCIGQMLYSVFLFLFVANFVEQYLYENA